MLSMTTLEWIDCGLMSAGGIVLAVLVISWRRSGRPDPLRGAPLRQIRLTPVHLLLCVSVHLAGGLVGGTLAVWAVPGHLPDEVSEVLKSILASDVLQIIVAATCLVVAREAFVHGWQGFGLGRQSLLRDLGQAGLGVLVAFCVCSLILLGTEWLIERFLPEMEQPDHGVFQAMEHAATPAWIRVVAVGGALLLAPIGEELFFRGIVQSSLHRLALPKPGSMRHRRLAILFAALLFGFMHQNTPQYIPALIVLGLLLGYAYERTGSLVVPILMHMLFNAKSLLWYALQQPAVE